MNKNLTRGLLRAVGIVAMLGASSIAWGLDPYPGYTDRGSSMLGEERRVNVNAAKVDELADVPGIGHDRAQAIVDYRDANGAFTDLDQLLNVKGISKEDLDAFRDKLTLW